MTKAIQYPFGSPRDETKVASSTFLQLLFARLETRRIRRRERRMALDIDMRCERKGGPSKLSASDMPLIFLTRNDRRYLPSFLAHYRTLGVTRFICVDDQSSDGTPEFLADQPDVDLWTSPVRYKEARRGRLWRMQLFATYGKGRWYVNVDSDEYLLFRNCGTLSLKELAARLESNGEWRLAAPMLDLFPAGNLSGATFDGTSERMPWEVADHFDAEGYRLSLGKRGLHLRGGLRHRKFGTAVELMKYPLVYWDESCSLVTSIHTPAPFVRNFIPIRGVLLHFKFFSDYRRQIQETVHDEQHFGNAAAYREMLEHVESETHVTFHDDVSRRFEGVDQLARLGFMQ